MSLFLFIPAGLEIIPSCHFFSVNKRVVVKMDPDVKKILILLIFQLTLFTTLECISREEERIFCGIGNKYNA
jgi:hypothetical protein